MSLKGQQQTFREVISGASKAIPQIITIGIARNGPVEMHSPCAVEAALWRPPVFRDRKSGNPNSDQRANSG
jgi:hypothetical protein